MLGFHSISEAPISSILAGGPASLARTQTATAYVHDGTIQNYRFDGHTSIADGGGGFWNNLSNTFDASLDTYAHTTTAGTNPLAKYIGVGTNVPTTGFSNSDTVKVRLYVSVLGTTGAVTIEDPSNANAVLSTFSISNGTVGWTGYQTLTAPSAGWSATGIMTQLAARFGRSGTVAGGWEVRYYYAEIQVIPAAVTLTSTQTATARIQNTDTLTQTSIARISSTFTRTQSAVSRVQNTRTATQSATANIQQVNIVTKTQGATARIQRILTRTQSATARISNSRTSTQSSIARISHTFTRTQTSVARIQRVLTATQTTTARIVQSPNKTQPAVARIANSVIKTQGSIARISKTLSTTQTATASIVETKTYTQTAIATISVTFTKTQPSVARLENSNSLNQTATARIGILYSGGTEGGGDEKYDITSTPGGTIIAGSPVGGDQIYNPETIPTGDYTTQTTDQSNIYGTE